MARKDELVRLSPCQLVRSSKRTSSVIIGKNDGDDKARTPKYFCARGPSSLESFAFAGNVHGGLLPMRVIIRPVASMTEPYSTDRYRRLCPREISDVACLH